MPNGLVVSDLHLLSRRSLAGRCMPSILEGAARSDFFVFNGDTVDFQWSTFASLEDSVREAETWIREVVTRFPTCRFHFVLGNHDYHPLFMDALTRLQMSNENLSWHEYYVRLGDCLFTHGDAATCLSGPAKVRAYRHRWIHAPQRGKAMNRLFDIVHDARVDQAFLRLYLPRRRVARRLYHYVQTLGPNMMAGLRHVYFGHTHRPFTDYDYDGLRFHNTGSLLRHMKFNKLEVRTGA